MSGSTTKTCTECGHKSQIPAQYAMASGNRSQTYCGNCGTVTLHEVSGAEMPEQTSYQTQQPVDYMSSPSVGNKFQYDPNRKAARDQERQQMKEMQNQQNMNQSPQSDDTNLLWENFLSRIRGKATLADVVKCDDTTRMRLFQSLDFDKYDQQRLLQISQERAPRNQIPTQQYGLYGKPDNQQTTTIQAPQAPPPGEYKRGSNLSYEGRPQGQQRTSPSTALVSTPSLISGLHHEGDQIIARCTVFPELPAEFWCCACSCLVSSRGHVVGIHKDHPFITLRLAAESHVREVAPWAERCRTQLNITESVIGNLKHSHDVLDSCVNQQMGELDKHVERMISEIYQWRDTIKRDIINQTESEHRSIEHSIVQTSEMLDLYTHHLQVCEPLLSNMPPQDQADRQSEDWALRFLDFVTKLKLVNCNPIAMPKILIPEIRCTFTASTATDVLKHVNNPIGVRLPDIIDPGYFHYPQPTTSTRMPFTLTMPPEGRQRGVLILNDRTLTMRPEAASAHLLLTGSQIFYSGTTSWEVHVDRMGHGLGRILAGVVMHGSDGEGVVWDGYRIVGPNEGETRTIGDQFRIRQGTILRFVLELDTPQSFLNCFFDREGVARIPLPAASSGWVPAFSVFGPQDQITVVPTTGAGAMEGAIPRNSSTHPSLRINDMATDAKIQQQELLIASLQKQLNDINTRINTRPPMSSPNHPNTPPRGHTFIQNQPLGGNKFHTDDSAYLQLQQQRLQNQQMLQQSERNSNDNTNITNFDEDIAAYGQGDISRDSAATRATNAAGDLEIPQKSNDNPKRKKRSIASFSPELEELLKFVDEATTK
eukprot:Tbor_TRINITY_DN4168_c0_g1::TRINITY_DN4168_c0_g1_i1::g.26440::m.26440